MSEALGPREERNLLGLEIAYASNQAYDRLQAAISKLRPYHDNEVETPEMDRLFRDVMPEVDALYADFYAYCTAAGALLLPEKN